MNGRTVWSCDAGTFGFGTAASHAATDFDTAGAASGAQAAAATDATNKVAAEATARAAAITALNLGTASTHPVTDFASPSAGNRPPPRLRLSSVVSTFDAGHGWTSTGWATSADDTTSGALASQSLKGTTTINVACVWEKTGLTLDTTGKDFVVWVNAAGLAPNVSGIRFQAFAGAGLTDYYEWYLVHNESITWQQVGEWCRYTLSFHDATPFGSPTRSNIQRLRWRIGDKNNVPLTLSVGGVALASQSTAFPNGVVSITTDDGHLSQYTTMRPIFNRYGFPATCYTIASRVDNPSFPTNMTSAQLRELERLDGWEIAGHAYDTANHDVTGGYSTLSLTNLRAELANLRAWLVSNNYRGRDHIAYPQGNYNSTILDETRKVFASARCTSFVLHETQRVADAMRLRSRAWVATDTVAAFQAEIDAAYANGSWLILTFHFAVASGATGNDILTANLVSIIDYLAAKGIPVRTVSEVMAATDLA